MFFEFLAVPIFHATCSIRELEPSTLNAICNILELEPFILHAMHSILNLEPSILIHFAARWIAKSHFVLMVKSQFCWFNPICYEWSPIFSGLNPTYWYLMWVSCNFWILSVASIPSLDGTFPWTLGPPVVRTKIAGPSCESWCWRRPRTSGSHQSLWNTPQSSQICVNPYVNPIKIPY